MWTGNRLLIVPPSIHPLTGTPYLFKNGEPDWNLGRGLIPPAPTWLIEKIVSIERLPASARPGGRHQDLLFFALRARVDNGLNVDELFEALKLYADYRGYDDKLDSELWRIAKDTVKKFDFDPGRPNLRAEEELAQVETINASFKKSWASIR